MKVSRSLEVHLAFPQSIARELFSGRMLSKAIDSKACYQMRDFANVPGGSRVLKRRTVVSLQHSTKCGERLEDLLIFPLSSV